jgi:hypothetical protein
MMPQYLCTHAIFERCGFLAVVGFVLLEEINKVKDAVALAAHQNIRLGHLLLRFCKFL